MDHVILSEMVLVMDVISHSCFLLECCSSVKVIVFSLTVVALGMEQFQETC